MLLLKHEQNGEISHHCFKYRYYNEDSSVKDRTAANPSSTGGIIIVIDCIIYNKTSFEAQWFLCKQMEVERICGASRKQKRFRCSKKTLKRYGKSSWPGNGPCYDFKNVNVYPWTEIYLRVWTENLMQVYCLWSSVLSLVPKSLTWIWELVS